MKLSQAAKDKLRNSCNKIYNAYSALALSKVASFTHNSTDKTTLESILSKAIKDNKESITEANNGITINCTFENKSYPIQITKRNGIYRANFIANIDPSRGDKISNLISQKFTLTNEKNNDEGNYVISCEIERENQQSIHIGGKGKLDLYPEHLDTLKRISQHLSADDDSDIKSMLIALATGSGKTFVQALWMLVLYDAGISSVFAVPSQLVDQFKSDIKNLLPNELVDTIALMKIDELNTEAINALHQLDKNALHQLDKNALHQLDKNPNIILASYEELLDEHYKTLNDLSEGQVALSFDEQHLVVNQEKRKIQLRQLANQQLNMFLTATPDESTYEICGSKPVAYMSSKQKAEANHGDFPELRLSKAVDLDERQRQLPKDNLSVFDKILLGFADSFLEQRSSAILSVFEQFQNDTIEYYYSDDKNPLFQNLRWSYQPPTSRKMLCLIDDNEELINLNNAIAKTDEYGDQKKYLIKFSNQKPSDDAIKPNEVIFYKNLQGKWEARICFLYNGITDISTQDFSHYFQNHQKGQNKFEETLVRYNENKNETDERFILNELEEMLPEAAAVHGQSRNLPVYQNGNLVPRDSIYQFIYQGENDIDKRIANEHRKYKQNKKTKINKIDKAEKVSLAEQLNRNVFSGIVDYLLSDLSGLSIIEMNEKRKDPKSTQAFYQIIKNKLQQLNIDSVEDYFFNKLKYNPQTMKGIDEAGAREIAVVIKEIIIGYTQLKGATIIEHFIQNWTLINDARDEMLQKNKTLFKKFTEYANKHRVLYVMKGMEQAETPIENDKPFFRFDEEAIKHKNDDGTTNDKAKKDRNLTVVETMNEECLEHHYYPQYASDITETIADNYFKLGFIGMYVSNKKTEGFSDLNLHTVISSVPSQVNSNNDPAKSIQGLGRLRAKDPTQKPLWFNAYSRGVSAEFDLNLLNEDGDYYPSYFEAKKSYNKNAIRYIGRKIGKEIADYLYTSQNKYDQINYREANDDIQLIILKAFREIYNNNNHDMELSKKYLNRALSYANDFLIEKQANLKVPYKINSSAAFIGSLLNMTSEVTYHFKTKGKKAELDILVKQKNPASPIADLYGCIIKDSDLKLLSEKSMAFAASKDLFKKTALYAESGIKSKITQTMTADEIQSFNTIIKDMFLPLLVKYINPEKLENCLMEAGQFNEWHEVFVNDQDILLKFQTASSEKRSEIAINLFRRVPKLYHYLSIENDSFTKSTELAEGVFVNMKNSVKERASKDVNKLVSEELLPALIKYFKPEAQSTILGTLQDYNNWSELLSSLDSSLINDLKNPEISPENKLSIMGILSETILENTNLFSKEFIKTNKRDYLFALTNGAENIALNIKQESKRDVTEQASHAMSSVAQGTKNFITKMVGKQAKPQVVRTPSNFLAKYFSGDFLKHIEPFFTHTDIGIFGKLFSNDKIANDFASYFRAELLSLSQNKEAAQQDVPYYLNLVKKFFKTYENGKYYQDVDQIVIVPERMQQSAKSLNEIQTKHLNNYIKTEGIGEFKHFLLHADWKILQKILSRSKNLDLFYSELSEAIIDSGDKFDKTKLAELIKKNFSSDDNYSKLNRNSDNLLLFADDIVNNILPGKISDLFDLVKQKYNGLDALSKEHILRKEFYPIISDPDIRNMILDTVGHFNQNQIEEFLNKLGHMDKQLPQEIVTFVDCYKKDKYEEIFSTFLKSQAIKEIDGAVNDSKSQIDISKIPFFKFFGLIGEMQQEQIRCHKYFNNITTADDQGDSILVKSIPPLVKACRIDNHECVVFLMKSPKKISYDNFNKSDLNNLYLYKESNGKIFYYLKDDTEKEKYYLEVENNNPFKLPATAKFNSVKYEDETQTKAILDITAGYGHTQQNSVSDEFSIFQLDAMRAGMDIASRVSQKTNDQYAYNLGRIGKFVLEPMMSALSRSNSSELNASNINNSRAIQKVDDLVDSSKKLGLRIGQLTPLTGQEVNKGTRYNDAIDTLIYPIQENPGLSFISDWWISTSKPYEFYTPRFDTVRNIDMHISHCDLNSNKDLKKVYDLCTEYLRNDVNYVFSRQYDDVRKLRRVVYGYMIRAHALKIVQI